jgi:hypothetical protein
MSRAAINAVGLLDEQHWPLWGATAEWQLRACRKGFRALPVAAIAGYHHERRGAFGVSITAALKAEPEKRDLLIRTPPLVSVVMPCYNYGRYLADALASLIGGPSCLGELSGQTFQGFEIVIVDDASTDDSWEIIQRAVNPWQGIRAYRHATNAGTAATLNTAIGKALGRYITFLSVDDMAEPTLLARYLETITANPHAVPYSDMVALRDGKRGGLLRMAEYDFEKLLERNQVPATTMFTRAAWQEIGGYPTLFGNGREDWAMAVALGQAGYCGQHIAEPLMLYRREGQNRSLRNGGERMRFVAQMRATFPKLYRGERPMGCCGGRRSAPARGARSNQVSMRIGETGMTLMEYVGINTGRTVVLGEVTGQRYVAKGPGATFYADNRDVPGLLDTILQRRVAFRRRAQAVAQAIETAVESTPYEEAVTDETGDVGGVETIMAEDLAIEESAPKSRKPRKPRKVAEEVA